MYLGYGLNSFFFFFFLDVHLSLYTFKGWKKKNSVYTGPCFLNVIVILYHKLGEDTYK